MQEKMTALDTICCSKNLNTTFTIMAEHREIRGFVLPLLALC